MQLQYVAQVFAGEILGDDLVTGPDPAQRRRSAGNGDRHPRRLAPLPTTHFCDEGLLPSATSRLAVNIPRCVGS